MTSKVWISTSASQGAESGGRWRLDSEQRSGRSRMLADDEIAAKSKWLMRPCGCSMASTTTSGTQHQRRQTMSGMNRTIPTMDARRKTNCSLRNLRDTAPIDSRGLPIP